MARANVYRGAYLGKGTYWQLFTSKKYDVKCGTCLHKFACRETTLSNAAAANHFVALSLWNSLSPDVRLIENHDAFKNIIRKNVNSEYLVHEMAKLTAGLFI